MHMRVFRLNTGSHMEADISIKEVWDSFFFPHIAQTNTFSVCVSEILFGEMFNHITALSKSTYRNVCVVFSTN